MSFYDPADTGPFELVCRHGSLTSAEMLVPLAGAECDPMNAVWTEPMRIRR